MAIPRAPQFDSTLSLVSDGYEHILNTCKALETDVYEGRLLLQKTIFMMGEEAARLFYDNAKFQRQGAMPGRIQKTLLGVGGVQGLDDAAHRHRKHLFVQQLMPAERIEALAQLTQAALREAASSWEHTNRLTLFPELQLILCRSVCRWAAVPLGEVEAKQRANDLGAMIESGGRIGPAHWQGRLARKRSEQWIGGLIAKVRSGQLIVPQDSALYAVALHRNPEGELLPVEIAAVELLNILRPTVAIARFMIFGALALHEHPEHSKAIAQNDDALLEMFAQEVRRFYPFFPQIAARVRHDFQWKGYPFPQGRRVILDLYGTNHDKRLWQNPSVFEPQRFAQGEPSSYGFIPQGGGDHEIHHRCPGEHITIALMKVFMRFLTQEISYHVPPQDMSISLTKIPTLPASGFIMEKVRRRKTEGPRG
jgi:fatty-acid peroxygenase